MSWTRTGNCRIGSTLFFTAIWLWSGVPSALGESMTPEELRAQFIQNALQAETLRITWTATSKDTGAGWEYLQKRVEINSRALADGTVPANEAEFVRKATEGLRKRTRPESPFVSVLHQDFWTDRNRFQWRFPHRRTDHARDDVAFPEAPLSPTSLEADFTGFSILTGGLDGEAGWRQWMKADKSDIGQGRIAVRNPRAGMFDSVFPPLALPQNGWGEGDTGGTKAHRIDQFFLSEPIVTRREGTRELDGRTVNVMTGLFHSDRPGKKVRALRVYIPDDQGAIPVRVEVFSTKESHQNLDWIPAGELADGNTKPSPYEVVHDVKLEEVSPGFWYPVSGQVDRYGLSPDHDTYDITGIPAAVYSVQKWTARKVEINREMGDDLFEFPFPPGTRYVDEGHAAGFTDE